MNANASTTVASGTKLVIGLILIALLLAIGLHLYRPSSNVSNVLQGQGPEAARQGIGLSQEGVKLLPPEEQRELGALYEQALQNLPAEEKQRFYTLAKKGQAVSDQELMESSNLIQQALRTLPTEKTERLLALVGKAVQLQMAQKPASSTTNK
jgi:hypothetical protein